MECHCIRAVDVPHITPLYSAYVRDFPSLAEFYSHPPTLDSVRQVAATLNYAPALRQEVAQALRAQNKLFGADASVEASLERFGAGAVAIVTGQQTGLFSGPAYTIYKALSALKLAADLTAAGTPAVAIFWLATEDHDLAEINHCFWPPSAQAGSAALSGTAGNGSPGSASPSADDSGIPQDATERLAMPPDGAAGRRVGEVTLGPAVQALVERAAS